MTKALLVVNGAEFSISAVEKAIRLTMMDKSELDILYINPSCNEMYPGAPDLSYWMPRWEYKTLADRLRHKVLDSEIVPISQKYGLKPRVLVSHRDLDEKIEEISEEHSYERIFIASPSKFCRRRTHSWFNFNDTTSRAPEETVCLI